MAVEKRSLAVAVKDWLAAGVVEDEVLVYLQFLSSHFGHVACKYLYRPFVHFSQHTVSHLFYYRRPRCSEQMKSMHQAPFLISAPIVRNETQHITFEVTVLANDENSKSLHQLAVYYMSECRNNVHCARWTHEFTFMMLFWMHSPQKRWP